MRIGSLLTFVGAALLGTRGTADAFTPLTTSEANQITDYLNQLRSTTPISAANMQRVSYDFAAQHKLDALIQQYGPGWLLQNATPTPIPKVRHNLNGDYVAETIGIGSRFNILWQDTCKKKGHTCVMVNLQFRAKQSSKCFNYNNCNTTDFNRYKSCGTALPQTPGGLTCSYAFDYYPQFITANMTKIAAAVLGIPGFKPPVSQRHGDSYWVFTDGTTPQQDDRPYHAGRSCTSCPPTHSRCIAKLCA